MVLKMRVERERRGWSLTDLTVKTGIDSSSLSMCERGLLPIYPGWRRRLVEVFGMPEAELFTEVQDGNGK